MNYSVSKLKKSHKKSESLNIKNVLNIYID